MPDFPLEVHHLTKAYNARLAVDGVTFKVPRGAVFGYLGPNGAGKTTTIKLMLGLLRPDAGEVFLVGLNPHKNPRAAFARVGYVPELPLLPPFLSGWDFLDFAGKLHGLSPQERRRRARELLDLVGLADHAGKKIGKYSKGMVQRLALAQGLMNDPELLVMDEPTLGMDPAATSHFRDLFRQLSREGRTIFLSSHMLDEVERLCGHVAMIFKGRIVFQGAMDEVTDRFTDRWVVSVELEGASERLIRSLESLENVEGVSIPAPGSLLIRLREKRDTRGLISREIARHGAVIVGMSLQRSSLEDVYLKALRDSADASA